MKKGLIFAAVCLIIGLTLVMTGCGGGGGGQSDSDLTGLRIALFDRNNAPSGHGTASDNILTQWMRGEAVELGIDVEWVTFPRDQEVQRLNLWMASGTAPDIVFTYNNDNAFQRYAGLNGLHQLDDLLERYGQAILERMYSVLDYGRYEGRQYAIPGIRTLQPAATMKIRQDWLDVLGMNKPETLDELVTVLRAFRDQDPGNMGSDRVVPFAIAPPGVVGDISTYNGLMYAFGIDVLGEFGGTFRDGVFRSAVDIPEARAFYRFLNMLYHEGLIHREFAVDTNGARYTQHVATGAAGLVFTNAAYMDPATRAAVPDVNWSVLRPFPDPNGTRTMFRFAPSRWLNLIPRTSNVPETAIQFINWMVEAEVDINLTYGFEGTHFNWQDGVIIPIQDEEVRRSVWNGGDLNLIGFVNYRIPRDKLHLVRAPREAEKMAMALEYTENYGVVLPVITASRPIAQERTTALQRYIHEAGVRLVVARDFDAEWESFVHGWHSLGGDEFDQEYEDALRAIGFTGR